MATRLRWVTVPKFMLNLFTKQNVPLSSWGTGIEFFRRKGNFDFAISLTYLNMSPHDGNWLGKGHDAGAPTPTSSSSGPGDVRRRRSFVWHTDFTDWFGMHYGAGIGIGIVAGDILRTSNDNAACNEANAGDLDAVPPEGRRAAPARPAASTTCAAWDPGPTTRPSAPLRRAERPARAADRQRRRRRRLPAAAGARLGGKIEGGFYNAFFLGGAVGYTF